MRLNVIASRASPVIVLAFMCVLGVRLQGSAAPSGGERVTFTSADTSVSALIPATVFRPAGVGPFPGIVLLHGCTIQPSVAEWAAWLQSQGYVAVLPDSLSPRNRGSFCGMGGEGFRAQALDGLGALAYLRNQPGVVPTKVAIMGWSGGGAATLISAGAAFINRTHPAGGGYQAAIAMYPVCRVLQDKLATPLLMLLGSADVGAPPAECVQRGTALQTAGAPIAWTVYPGATHEFDESGPERVSRILGRPFPVKYDQEATADAHIQVQRFLRRYLQ